MNGSAEFLAAVPRPLTITECASSPQPSDSEPVHSDGMPRFQPTLLKPSNGSPAKESDRDPTGIPGQGNTCSMTLQAAGNSLFIKSGRN
jgi:hypothetical protein